MREIPGRYTYRQTKDGGVNTVQPFANLDPSTLSDTGITASRDQAIAQMRWMRGYTMQLLDSVPADLWNAIPPGGHTHFAWQAGHLAVAQYGLMLFLQRGRMEMDLKLMPGWLRKGFGRGTVPVADLQARQPTRETILEHMQAIHEQAMREAVELPADSLRQPAEMPYAVYPIRLGALIFCPLHESIHAGQIGMLRRSHGLDPIR